MYDMWELIRAGATDEGLRQMREAYVRKRTPSHIMSLGVAYLWVADYIAAWEHFDSVNRQFPNHAAPFYAMAGAAKWCLNQPDDAVAQWRTAATCDYVDVAGGVKSPLLLFCASVLRPEVCQGLRNGAVKLLTVRANDRRVKRWPGPLAEFVIGRINENTLRAKCPGTRERGTMVHHWLADFYLGILACARGDDATFKNLMRKTADISRPEWANDGFFVGCIWNAEFFLARHEAATFASTGATSSV